MAGASEEIGLDVEDDVWNAVVVRLGSGYTQPVWGYVGPHTEQPVPSYTAYEPPTSMYENTKLAANVLGGKNFIHEEESDVGGDTVQRESHMFKYGIITGPY
ncbi:hypothetical protein GQ457_15G019880 [Hibiscus cannabinus]